MRYASMTMPVLLCALGLSLSMSSIASGGEGGGAGGAGPTVSTGLPIYNPPKRGMPGGRLGGGTRGMAQQSTVLSALAPDHTGLTVQEQPTLYWYLFKPTAYQVLLTVIDTESMKTVLEIKLETPSRTGVQAIRLRDMGVSLIPGVQYQWFVAIMVDPEHRSKDILAGGRIERTALPDDLSAKLAGTGRAYRASLYAEAGLWYDAVEAISEEISALPNDAGLRKQRATLLEQVGLAEIAAHDVTGVANERS